MPKRSSSTFESEKDGLRDEWYARFDLATPAADRNMPFTGVIERPDLQQILLDGLAEGVVTCVAAVVVWPPSSCRLGQPRSRVFAF